MPLSQSQGLEQFSFVASESFPFCGDGRPKRKLENHMTYDQTKSLADWTQQMGDSLTQPKRLCLDVKEESQPTFTDQTENVYGCLKNLVQSDPTPPFETSGEALEHQPAQVVQAESNLNTVGMEEDILPQDASNLHHESELENLPMPDAGASMEMDFVPDTQQYNLSPSHTPPSHSRGQFCGCVSCNGLKRSPATGRLHCHCYASWRGMYGIDCSYYNDYY